MWSSTFFLIESDLKCQHAGRILFWNTPESELFPGIGWDCQFMMTFLGALMQPYLITQTKKFNQTAWGNILSHTRFGNLCLKMIPEKRHVPYWFIWKCPPWVLFLFVFRTWISFIWILSPHMTVIALPISLCCQSFIGIPKTLYTVYPC